MRPERQGLYLHIPYCLSKCNYCDFDSQPLRSAQAWPGYTAALVQELRVRAQGTFDTVYWGGGTPSLMPAASVRTVHRRLKEQQQLAPQAEITLEANPATAGPEELEAWLQAGVNRLSIGVQSTSDRFLQLLGRRHSAAAALQFVREARQAGFQNLSCDLIFGLPGQSLAEFQTDLSTLIAWGPEHISLYGLTLGARTPLAQAIEAGQLERPDDDLAADMYVWARTSLAEKGFEQYELSNFSRPGRTCQHNWAYWSGDPYLGVGAGAHSYQHGVRSWNLTDPEDYQHAIRASGQARSGEERLTGRTRIAEALMLGLRRTEGLSHAEFNARLGEGWSDDFILVLEQLAGQGLLENPGSHWKLTPQGMLLSNIVFRALL